MVLYTLEHYRSPELAGMVGFFNLFPGMIVSPIGGALLDRHGRTRLVVLDYLVALAALVLIGALAFAGHLAPWLLIVIAGIASLTNPLSGTGLRSLLPLIVPSHLWERVNAVDSTGYVIAAVIGPPFAAFMVSVWSGPAAFIVIGLSFGLAALVIAGTPDPPSENFSTGSLLLDAWQGLQYTWRNRTLRGLGFGISVLNLNSGTFTIVVPLIVLERLHLGETMVGLVLAAQGLAGVASAFFFGRHDTRGRERTMLMVPMIGMGATVAMLLIRPNLAVVVLVMLVTGLLNGPLDIALFTLRQRRTARNWTGRAFAISMSFNGLGLPLGSAMAGAVAARSIEWAIVLGVAASVTAGILTAVMIDP